MASATAGAPSLFRNEAAGSRPLELEDGLNRFVYHPLAAQLARRLVPTGISPNLVSVAGMLVFWSAAFAYTRLAWPTGVLLGFSLQVLWHIVDGADGDLARLTGKASPTGELVDGVCDYAGYVVLYIALAAMLDDSLGGWAWLIALLAGASHLVQTNHTETQRRTYLWWVYGVPWLKHAKAQGDQVFEASTWFSFLFGWLARLYLRAASAMAPAIAQIDRELDAAAGDPARTDLIRRLARRASRRSLLLQKVLGSNPRTIIIALSMLAGSPLYFFLTEVVVLNLLLVLSVRHHNRAGRRLAERLQRLPSPAR